jgi:transposase
MVVTDSGQPTPTSSWRRLIEDQQRHLTTIDGWRRFTTDTPEPPDPALPDDARLDYHTRLAVVATSTLRQVINAGRRLTLLNRHAISARRGLILSGPAGTGKTTAITQLGKTHNTIDRARHPGLDDRIPVVYVTVPPAATPRMLAVEFARFLGLPITPQGGHHRHHRSRQLRDVTRYRRSLIREQTREYQRLEKLLEDAQIKLTSVISGLDTVSGRRMLQAMIDGQRDPAVLADMACGSMRRKIPVLREALTGHFEDHHAFLCRKMLDRIEALAADIAALDTRIEQLIAPFVQAAAKLDEITGVGQRAAQELVAEIGVDMTVFPTAAHLVSWAKFAPIEASSAGRRKGGSTGKGNPWLAGTLGEIVAATARTDTFLGERYRRLVRRRGKKRAVVAVGNSVLTIIWHLLSDPDARYHDLGADYHQSRLDKGRRQRDLIRQLEHLTGQKVTLQPSPDLPTAA